jgi:hypothetical protein
MKQTGWFGNYAKDIRITQAVRSTSCGRNEHEAPTFKLQRNLNNLNPKTRRLICLWLLEFGITLNIGV